MDEDLFPLRSLSWRSGVVAGRADQLIDPGPFGDPDDWQEIRLMLRTRGA